ncbi:bacteriocin [Streptococcus ovis]|uniref:bacteriocin n=1 Tax=Streptococcus ovis TaxID=82806 RepID=UPI00037E6F00|nr:bacteriocin [Streptococcus ovis]
MNTQFKTLNEEQLQVVVGGQQMRQIIIGGQVAGSYPVFNNPWNWAVGAAGEWVKKNRRN